MIELNNLKRLKNKAVEIKDTRVTGRCTYEYYQTEKITWFEEYKEWKGLKSFIYVSKKMEDLVTGEIKKENR